MDNLSGNIGSGMDFERQSENYDQINSCSF